MLYKKKDSPYYYPRIVHVYAGEYTVCVNYSEITDESCVEFSHVHNDYEIYYCLDGGMHQMIDGECETIDENCFSVIRPNAVHNTIYEPLHKKNYFIFVFEEPVINPAREKASGTTETGQFIKAAIDYLKSSDTKVFSDRFNCREIIERIALEHEKQLPGYRQMLKTLYCEFMIHIFRNFELIQTEQQKEKHAKSDDNLNMALELTQYMHNHYNQDIMVKDAAEYFHISERHVNRVFEKYFGESFKHTLNIYRINYAKNYLLDTDYSLEKIAELVGISSTKKFHRLFKEIEHKTPTQFREIHKNDRTHHYSDSNIENGSSK